MGGFKPTVCTFEEMGERAVIFWALLAVAAGGSIFNNLPECSVENRDCSCADKSFKSCDEPKARNQSHVDDLEGCMVYCDEGECDWFIYNNDAAGSPNCQLFTEETMEEYLQSCVRSGQPVRRIDGSCTANWTTAEGACDSKVCPEGCVPCDDSDKCYLKYHETECSMLSPTLLEMDTPDLATCLAVCAVSGQSIAITYATWDTMSLACHCHQTGARSCARQVVKAGFDLPSINDCIGGPPPTPTTTITTTTTTTPTTTITSTKTTAAETSTITTAAETTTITTAAETTTTTTEVGCWDLAGEDLVVTEYSYTYSPWTSPSLSFKVKTPSHSLVSLAPTNEGGDLSNPRMDLYEIEIGGWGDNLSQIRRGMQGDILADAQTPEIVSPDEYRGFWITGEVNADGFMEIKVGKEGERAFMIGVDVNAEPLEWKFTGFAGWPNAVGNYNNICANTTEVKYNCPEMNQEFGHHTIDQIDGVFTWEECAATCLAMSDCLFWTLDNRDGHNHRCKLKNSDAGFTPRDGFISGERGCPIDGEIKF